MSDSEETGEGAVTPIANTDIEDTPGYKPPAVKTLNEITNLDQDDESLVRYKQALLGNSSTSPADDPRRVIVEQMSFLVAGREDVNLDLTGDLTKLKEAKIIVKEGVEYRLKVVFKVHHEIVAGLRYHHVVKRKGINLDKHTYMVGSYGPKVEQQSWTSPVNEAPKGMLTRGSYKIESRFTDDDKHIHLEWDWSMEIKKDWV